MNPKHLKMMAHGSGGCSMSLSHCACIGQIRVHLHHMVAAKSWEGKVLVLAAHLDAKDVAGHAVLQQLTEAAPLSTASWSPQQPATAAADTHVMSQTPTGVDAVACSVTRLWRAGRCRRIPAEACAATHHLGSGFSASVARSCPIQQLWSCCFCRQQQPCTRHAAAHAAET